MALTGAQTTAIRGYLGYANLNRYKNTRLEGTFTALDADGEAAVVLLLTSIAAADAALSTAALTTGGLKKVDEVEFFPSSGAASGAVANIRAQGRRLIGRLSLLLGVPFYGDYFGGGGYPGDTYSDLGLSGPNSGGMFRLG